MSDTPENTFAPLLALLPSEADYHRFGVWLGENAPRLFEAARDPLYAALGVAGLALFVGAAVCARAALPAAYHRAARDLAAGEGAITWGYRNQTFLDGLARLPVSGLWSDRTMGVQLVAPTGAGKTQALLPLIVQDLEAGRDALVVEVSGDLGLEAEEHARARGAEVLKVDASEADALALNPIYADSDEVAANRAAAMKAIATNHPYYSDMNMTFARHFVTLARDHKRHQGRDPGEATLSDVREFAMKIDHLKKVVRAAVEVDEDGEKRARVEAEWLSKDTADWLEQVYLPWRPDDRYKTVSGFVAYLDNLLGTAAARRCLCPEPGEARELLDLAREVSDEAREPARPGEMGRLIVLRFPSRALPGESSTDTAYWAVKTVIDATLSGRSTRSTPLSVVFDELPTLIGDASHAALKDFQLFITNVRKFGVAVHVAYQGWALLPKLLGGTLRSNGRNILISGGMGGEDAEHAQDMLGSELQEVSDERHDVGGSYRRSLGRRVVEKPRFSIGEIQRIPRGQWWLLRLHRGDHRDPVVIRVPLAELPTQAARDGVPSRPRDAAGEATREQGASGGGASEDGQAEADPHAGTARRREPESPSRSTLLANARRRRAASGRPGTDRAGRG